MSKPARAFAPGPKEFVSVHGATIMLGNFKKTGDPKFTEHKEHFVCHDSTSAAFQSHQSQFREENKGGVSLTRFGRGFKRRYESEITNPVKEEYHQISQLKTVEVKRKLNESRSQNLQTVDNYNGYNIITGVARSGPGSIAKTRVEGKKLHN
jgi:hypothetical protein